MTCEDRYGSKTATAGASELLFDEVRAGLLASTKRLPEKLFYDDRGTTLFEAITQLEVYYPTRTEIGILNTCLPEVGRLVGPRARVVEFGTGDGTKTSLLLDALEAPAACIPIDIAEGQLLIFADRLQVEYPGLDVLPLVADYTLPFELPQAGGRPEAGRPLFFFPGSTIGNFEPDAAERFLARVGRSGGDGAALLIGVDRVKEAEVLESAYDDPDGVTAEFNLNALRHVNRVLGADFVEGRFRHRAVWNRMLSRIEMHLVSEVDQEVTVSPDLPGRQRLRIPVAAGEAIVTEHSYKFHPKDFVALCARAGWSCTRSWTDRREWFSVHFLEWEG